MTLGGEGQHLVTVAMQDVLDTFVVGDESAERSYLRAKWIETVMLQMISARAAAQLSQSELGARIGKPQSSIARIERGSDIKLSTLFDYLSAAGMVPVGEIPCETLEVQRQGIHGKARGYREAIMAHSFPPGADRTWAAMWNEHREQGIDLSKPSRPGSRDTENQMVKAAAA